MATKKRIVVSGYYGFDNTGDEAVLYSIIQALDQECKEHDLEIIVLSNQPEQTSKLYGVKAINRWDIKEIYKQIKVCDLLISGGGSLLQDITSNKTVPYYLSIIKMAQWHKKEVVFYSQGFGPVSKTHSKYLIKKVLNKVNYIFVRDENSKKALIEIGITKPSIMVTADPVLGMEPNEEITLKMQDYIRQCSEGKPRVGIYLRSWKNDSKLMEKISVLCQVLDERGIAIFFIPMQQPDDMEFLKKIDFKKTSAYNVTKKLDIQEVFALTGQMDIVIGMRLHALIMATAQGIPVVGLSYDPKVEDFMKMIDNKHCFDIETFSPEDVANSVMTQIEHIKKEKETILAKRDLLINKVYEPAKLVRKILN